MNVGMEDLMSTTRYVTWSLHIKVIIMMWRPVPNHVKGLSVVPHQRLSNLWKQ